MSIYILIAAALLLLAWIANSVLLKSAWYRGLLADPEQVRYPSSDGERASLDLVNIGSSSALHALCYDGLNVRASNWAAQPQTLDYGLRILQNFRSSLHPGSVVLISLCPFTSINNKQSLAEVVRYARTLPQEMLDERYRKKALRLAHYPILFGKQAVKELVKLLIGYRRTEPETTHDETWFALNARQWASGWAREFSIADLHAPLTAVNRRGREARVATMRRLVDFCLAEGWRPVYVIPPIGGYLLQIFDADFQRIYIDDYLAEVDRAVPVLNYIGADDLTDVRLFADAYFLGPQGAAVFTPRVLEDLRRLGLL